MKSIKNKILSVLLFTFAFFVMHDYVVVDHHVSSKYELCHLEYDEQTADVKAHLHEAIHTILAVNFENELIFQPKLPDAKPASSITGFTSHINFVPQRPPLS
ncbi:hypothetical protein [Sulfurimonas sp.]|uniref:hypothetical protein n=1 Tax=Sulfurimonas sp. TaxID=2022749 RepID=UPI003569AE4D